MLVSNFRLELRAVRVFAFDLIFDLFFNFRGGPYFPFSDSGAEFGDFATPCLGVHNFGPKWPGSTLSGTPQVDAAPFVF